MENGNNIYTAGKTPTKSLVGKKPIHLTRCVFLLISIFISIHSLATINLPNIPSAADFDRLYEFNTELTVRVNLDDAYLESGAIIAYIGNQIRGAQTESKVFPLSGDKVYKLRLYSNSATGEVMTLKYYDIFNDKIYDITETITFTSNEVPDFENPTILHAFCPTPVVATLVSPGNNTTGLDNRVNLSWTTSSENTHYGLLLWKNGDPQPTTTYYSNIYTAYTTVYNLNNAQAYNWRIISYNGCNSDTSETYSFSTRIIPDLHVIGTTTPSPVQSATTFNIQYSVQNTSDGPTTESRWYDGIYISEDDIYDGSDLYLGRVVNETPVAANSSYNNNLDVILPAEYEGTYHIFVLTDIYNNIKETNNTNNTSDAQPIVVELKPLPNIGLTEITFDKTEVQPGDSITVSWTVENSTAIPAEGGWTEKVSLNTLSGIKIQLTGSPSYQSVLDGSASVLRSMKFKIPKTLPFSGNTHFDVELFPNAQLIEEPGGASNNTLTSLSTVNIGSQLYISMPTYEQAENSGTQLRCQVSRSSNSATPLDVSLSVDVPGQITIPSNVTIPASSYNAIFYLSMVDNAILDGSRIVQITANAAAHGDTTVAFTVHDNEIATISASFDSQSAFEGNELPLTVSRNLITNDDVIITLSTQKPSQWTFTKSVTIPANEVSVETMVTITDDDIPELNQEVSIIASSPGMNQGQASLLINDDDIPGIEFEIFTDTISESGGPYATMGVVRKTDPEDKNVRVRLTASSGNQIYYPADINIPIGTSETQFNIGAIDNALVDGNRVIDLTCAVYLSSCNCTTTETNGGIFSDGITILDNDGPSLSVTFNPISLPEGKADAGQMNIYRNTPTDGPLTVYLFHNDASELSLPPSIVIEQGQSTAQATISTLNDDVEDGNQMVNIKAEAAGFSPGIGWVYVTDQNKPDLEPTDLTLSSTTTYTGEQIEVRCNILNNGFAPAPSGVAIEVYLSENNQIDSNDEVIGKYQLAAPIAASEFFEFWELITIPDQTGDYYILLKVNPNSKNTELVYINNQSNAAELTILPSYSATAIVDETQFLSAEPITIYGAATSYQGDPMPNTDIDVYLISNGIREVIEVTTNEAGDYTTTFEPLASVAGHYSIGACFPDEDTDLVQDEFDILGMKRIGDRYLIWDILFNVDNPGTITMQNRSSVDLTNVIFKPTSPPDGFELTIDTIDILPGNGEAAFSYNIVGSILTEGNDYIEIPVNISSNEGASHNFVLYYYCQSQKGHLKASPSSINTTMTKNKSRLYEIEIFNDGAGETGETVISIPDLEWMSLVSQDTIETINPGDTATVTLQLLPDESIPLNTPLSGSIAINIENGQGVTIPYRIETVSEETGNLLVDVVDEYTYYTEEAPHVENAHVVLRHPFSGAVIADGFTAADGTFAVDNIPEGSYKLYVQADKHENYQNVITIDPGRTKEQKVYLSFQAITYTWEVIQTEIEDEYEVELIMEFETNVPVPVVIMETPKEMPALIGDETYTFMATLTNKGLITAQNVELTFPTDPEYEFITNYSTMDLLAQQAIQVPVIMRRKDAYSSPSAQLKASSATQGVTNCRDVFVATYEWECGEDGRWQKTRTGFVYVGRVCDGTGVDTDPLDGGGSLVLGPVRGTGPDGGSGPYTGPVPVIEPTTASCQECIEGLFWALVGCVPGGSVPSCLGSFRDGITVKEAVICALGVLNAPGNCAIGITDALITCFNSILNGPGGAVGGLAIELHNLKGGLEAAGDMPPIIEQAATDLLYVQYEVDAITRYMDEYFGTLDWRNKESILDFTELIYHFIDNNLPITPNDVAVIKTGMADTDILPDEIDAFVTRWNQTVSAWNLGIYSPSEEYPDIIDKTVINGCFDDAEVAHTYASDRGFNDVGDMYDQSLIALNEQVDEGRKSVCASVTIKISQKLTMTREAFEGTLTIYNGNKEIAIEEVNLDLMIWDEYGQVSNDLFEIETKALDILTGIDGTGSLGADQTGSATILFIPEKGAAPTVPKSYSFGGTLSYLDPFTGTTVTKPLFPVTLDVHPSPDLTLHYFMQRDILGDDALTQDVVEPIVPAELAVMIENNGYGTAKNVKIESAQPEIIENEKGLAIHFELIGSNLQGQPTQLGLTNIDFGNINPMSAKIGQWWFTSDLLGHFINYETKLTHLDSRGNPDLSLVSGAELHELIKSISVYGALDDGINDFLINEIQDAYEVPDAIYLSQGQVVLDVEQGQDAIMTGNVTGGTTTLFVTPEHIGWNYIKINDPGHGLFSIKSVVRVSDDQILPLKNVWLTHVTLPDGKEPVYENKLHFIDDFPSMNMQEYIVTWKVNSGVPPKIVSIDNIPEQLVTEQVTSATVTFSKPIDASTFTYEDMTLRLQGGADIMNSSVSITPIDAYSFEIDLTPVTTGDGYYVLNIQAAEVKDQMGIKGEDGKQASWTQFLGAPAIVQFIGLPDAFAGPPFNEIEIEFNLPVNIATVTPDRFSISRDGVTIDDIIEVTHLSGDTLFRLSGLADFMTIDGYFELSVDLTAIESSTGVFGLIHQNTNWRIDTTPPDIFEVRPISTSGYDRQHYASFEVEFSEPVTNFGWDMIDLWKNGQELPLSQVHVDKINSSTWLLSQFRLLTYYEGDYTLQIHMEEITDSASLSGSSVYEYNWTVNRDVPAEVENLHITPDLGISNTDGISSGRELNAVMTVIESGNTIELYRNDNGTLILLAQKENAAVGTLTMPFTLPSGGNMILEAHAINSLDNASIASIPIYIDEAPLAATINGAPSGEADMHPASVNIIFSRDILENTLDNSLFEVLHNNVAITLPDLTVTAVSDSIFSVEGWNNLPHLKGEYKLRLNTTALHKKSSGIAGANWISVTWTLKSTNNMPVADAGADLMVTETGTYQLDATGSSDPDGDDLTYLWYTPEGITLDNVNSATPQFTITEGHIDKTYTFILAVDDGYSVQTDKVDVIVLLATDVDADNENQEIKIFPVPSDGWVYISCLQKIKRIQVFNTKGQSVYLDYPDEAEIYQLELLDLDYGIYYVAVFIDKKIVLKKILITP